MSTDQKTFGQRVNERLQEVPERFAVNTLSPLHPNLSELEAISSGVIHIDQMFAEMMPKGVLFPDHVAIIEHFLEEGSTAPASSGERNTPQDCLNLKPGTWGTKDGLPAISWWRHGCAAAGEPRIVTEVRTYPDEQARYDAFFKNRPAT